VVTQWSRSGAKDGGSIPPAAISELKQFHSPHIACLSEGTLGAVGPLSGV